MTNIARRLRLVLGRGGQPSGAEVEPLAAVDHLPPQVEFAAYAEDCRVYGQVRLSAERLTDMLNEHEEIELVDVLVESLADGTVTELPTFVVARDELVLVQATGPRGHAGRRQRTRPHPVEIEAGPYRILGYLHTLPGADPFRALRRRPAMVPLTDARVTYVSGRVEQEHRAATLIFNRELIDWIAPSTDEEVRTIEMPRETGPLVKDFTGQILA